ncbi:MAG: hypothetical protein K8R99_10560 [Actinomycetia bacterium]|nr:hypothetical protein [Actinomycetes bacterium]
MLLLPRLRFALARRPWLYWLFVTVCAAIVWSMVASAQTRLHEQRDQWGETRRVWVATVDVAPGDVIHAVGRDYPIAMVAPSAIDEAPVDAIATTLIAAGEVLVASDVAATSERTLPSDWVVFALGIEDSPALRPGNDVALFGSGQRWCEGVVVALGDESIEVGVPPECASAASAQIAADAIVLAATTR